jgi:dienelactone hydrolase
VELMLFAKHERAVSVPAHGCMLRGWLARADQDHGLVVVVRGVAPDEATATLSQALTEAGIGTLRVDLLTAEEQSNARIASCRRNDVELLGRRLSEATDWLTGSLQAEGLVGYFGADMESAAVVAAAAQRPALVSAVVLCDGRPLLAEPALPQVRAATLLIAPERDLALVRVNRAASGRLLCQKRLALVPGADRLLHDPSAVSHVAQLACEWFERGFHATRSDQLPDSRSHL